MSMPSDPAEQEAERVADSIAHGERVKVDLAPAKASVPRAANEDERGGEPGAEPLVRDVLETSGAPLDAASRARLEPSFGQDLSSVRVHTDAPAARSAEAVSAKAYTAGDHIVFGAGHYAPHTDAGAHLIAHEVTHVVQQSQGLARSPDEEIKVQRDETDNGPGTSGSAAAASAGSPPPAGSAAGSCLIAEDGAGTLDPKQMYKSAFLGALRAAVDQVVDETVTDMVDRIAAGPIVAARFATYSGKDARSLEQEIKSQTPGAQGAASAAALIPAVAAKVRADIEADKAEKAKAKPSGIFFKGREGGPNDAADPKAIQAQLQGGEAIPSQVRSSFESAMGQDFSGVRVHTGTTATKLSNDLNARAFTVGRDIAFGAGEYKPGTPVGDALIAHELAHVAQQGGGAAGEVAQKSESAHDGPLEQDADDAAAGAVVSIWGGVKEGALGLARKAGARLKSGLKLQRCSGDPKKEEQRKKREEEKKQEEEKQRKKREEDLKRYNDREKNAGDMGKHVGDKMKEINRHMEQPNPDVTKGVWYEETLKEKLAPQGQWDEKKYHGGFTSVPNLQKTGNYAWWLTGGSASAALNGWFEGLTVADCASTMTASQYSALLNVLGPDEFDRRFDAGANTPMIISQSTPVLLAEFLDEGSDNFEVGDRVYVANHPMYSLKHPEGYWQGEHATVVEIRDGTPYFTGFGVGVKTEDQLLEEMLEQFNAPPSGSEQQTIDERKKGQDGKDIYANVPMETVSLEKMKSADPVFDKYQKAGVDEFGAPKYGVTHPKAGIDKRSHRHTRFNKEKVAKAVPKPRR